MDLVSNLVVIKENWLRKASLAIVPAILLGAYIMTPRSDDQVAIGILKISNLQFGTILLIACVAYLTLYAHKSRLPRAKKGSLSVLFVIEAETDELYEAAKYKLVNNFENLVEGSSTTHFEATCIPKKRIKKINMLDKEQAQALLQKTNCMFYVGVYYKVDDANNAENFEMTINCGVVHPFFIDRVEEIFARDLTSLTGAVHRQRFHRANSIEVFNSTAQTLSYICQYMLGLVYLFSSDNSNAHRVFYGIQDQLKAEHQNIPAINRLKNLTKERIFATEAQLAELHIREFENTKELECLQKAKVSLNQANLIHPDTYWYNTNMAYIYIALDRNGYVAKSFIDKCRHQNRQQEWKYSDAFLCAYLNHSPQVVIAKYKKASLVQSCNLLKIADYIEYIIEQQPHLNTLHLAAGLVYELIGDKKMMKYHFSIYIQAIPDETKTINLLSSKMENMACDEECDHNCDKCIAS